MGQSPARRNPLSALQIIIVVGGRPAQTMRRGRGAEHAARVADRGAVKRRTPRSARRTPVQLDASDKVKFVQSNKSSLLEILAKLVQSNMPHTRTWPSDMLIGLATLS